MAALLRLPLVALLVLVVVVAGAAGGDVDASTASKTFRQRLEAQLAGHLRGADPATRERLRELMNAFLVNDQSHRADDATHSARLRSVGGAPTDVGAKFATPAAMGNAGGVVSKLKKDVLLRQHKPFRERLAALLPGDADGFVTLAEVAAAEPEILKFHVPRRTVVDLMSSYVPVSWRGGDANNNLDACPNCVLRLKKGTAVTEVLHASSVDAASLDAHTRTDAKAADVLVNVACPSTEPKKTRTVPPQLTVGGCGESQVGTGSGYFRNRERFGANAGFFPSTDPLSATFYRRELSLPEHGLTTVTSQVEYLLTVPPVDTAREAAPLMFTHRNCGGGSGRGNLIQQLIRIDEKLVDRWGSCFNNRDPKEVEPQSRDDWFWHDSEGNRDATKTAIATRYLFTASMENTLSKDYFTEKRYEAFFANSVPLVYKNHNSEDYLPGPHSAVFPDDFASAQALADYLRYVADNKTAYDEYFAWKRSGKMRASFVHAMFRGDNFIPCRICEHYHVTHGV